MIPDLRHDGGASLGRGEYFVATAVAASSPASALPENFGKARVLPRVRYIGVMMRVAPKPAFRRKAAIRPISAKGTTNRVSCPGRLLPSLRIRSGHCLAAPPTA